MQDREHAELETEATKFLESLDFLVVKQPYHEFMPDEVGGVLRHRFSLTSLYVRGRADRLAIHPELEIDFGWEAKTVPSDSPDYNKNLAIEIWPLIHHIHQSRLGVRCLYVCRHCKLDYECGFWVDDLPLIFRIMFPTRSEYEPVRSFMKARIAEFFPDIRIEDREPSRKPGVSNDPYVLIGRETAMGLSHWKDLIRAELPVTSF